jgi:ATP-dependent NAD(P)H-hydrate dehydratase
VKTELEGLLQRLHVLVLGPGLGREDYMQRFAKIALGVARAQGMYVVIDADGLWMVGQHLDTVRGYRRAVLTPNVMEFKRLAEATVSRSASPSCEQGKLTACRTSTRTRRRRSARR